MNDIILPSGKVSRKWIEEQYFAGKKQAEILAGKVTKQQINARLEVLSATPGGFDLAAKEGRSPLLREVLYESRSRSLAMNYKLSQGESAEFWADIAVSAANIGVDGLPQVQEIRSDYRRVDTRLFAGSPYVRWNQQSLTKFDIMAAVQQRLKASLMLQEAAAWYRAVKFAAQLTSGQGTVAGLEGTSAYSANARPFSDFPTSTPGKLSITQLAEAQAAFGGRGIEGALKIWMNPVRRADFVTFNNGNNGGLGFFAPNTIDTLLTKGFQGALPSLGMDVVSDIVVPTNEVFILGPADFVGLVVIRTDLAIETMKDPNRLADVLTGWMDIGFYIRWVKAIQMLKV